MTDPVDPVQTSLRSTWMYGTPVFPGLGFRPNGWLSRNVPVGVRDMLSLVVPVPCAPMRAWAKTATRRYRPSAWRAHASTVAYVLVDDGADTVMTCAAVVAALATGAVDTI